MPGHGGIQHLTRHILAAQKPRQHLIQLQHHLQRQLPVPAMLGRRAAGFDLRAERLRDLAAIMQRNQKHDSALPALRQAAERTGSHDQLRRRRYIQHMPDRRMAAVLIVAFSRPLAKRPQKPVHSVSPVTTAAAHGSSVKGSQHLTMTNSGATDTALRATSSPNTA